MDNEEKIRKEIGPVDKKVSLFSVEFLLSPWAIATLTFTIFISLILIGCSFPSRCRRGDCASTSEGMWGGLREWKIRREIRQEEFEALKAGIEKLYPKLRLDG